VVDKSKAKKVFEDVIRRRVDPSLIEKTIGNNFRLRLYPLLAKKSKKVKITIEEVLHLKSNNYEYRVPFVVNDTIKDFSINIFAKAKEKPVLDFFEEEKTFHIYEDGYHFSYTKKNVQLNKAIALHIPKLVEVSSYYQEIDGKRLFMSVLQKREPSSQKALVTKQKLQLVWDSSLSALTSSQEKKFEFLDALFSQDIEYEISLFTLALSMQEQGSYVVKNGNWGVLKAKLKSIRFHGAKDLSALKISNDANKVLLFSNGLNTFSDDLLESSSKPVYTINSNVKSAPNVLKYLAKMSGGKYINLLRDSASEALKRFSSTTDARIVSKSKNPENYGKRI
jgi:hypothetical protein